MPRHNSKYVAPSDAYLRAPIAARQAVYTDLHVRFAVERPALALVPLRATRLVRESEEFISQQYEYGSTFVRKLKYFRTKIKVRVLPYFLTRTSTVVHNDISSDSTYSM